MYRVDPIRSRSARSASLALRALLGCALVLGATRARAQSEQASSDADAVGFSDTEAAPSSSEDAGAGTDAIGFSDTDAKTPAQKVDDRAADDDSAASSSFVISGFLRSLGALWVERLHEDPVASLRQTLRLAVLGRKDFALGHERASLTLHATGEAAYDLAYLHDRAAYDAPTLETYETDLIARELQASLVIGAFELAVGRQIVNWGQGEVLQVLDVINPRDLREPGVTPAAEMRLSTLMTRAGLSIAPYRFELIAVHESFFGYLPPPLGRFSPLRELLFDTPGFERALAGKDLRYRHEPGQALIDPDATQYHARLSYGGEGLDLALHAGSVLDPLGIPSLPAPAELAAQDIDIPLFHPRYSMLGMSAAVPAGSLLLRSELAAEIERPLAVRRIDTPLLVITEERHTQLDALLGITWFIAGSTTAALELTQGYVPANPARRAPAVQEPLWPIEATRIALRFDYRFLRERASLSLLGMVIGVSELNAWIARVELSYALADALGMLAGFISYHPEQHFGPFYGFGRNDRAYLALQWEFSSE